MKKILVVDDDPIIRRLLNEILALSPDYSVLEAENGGQAIELAHQEYLDLVLLDLEMPGKINGADVCRHLKKSKKTHHPKVLMVTGCTNQNLILKSFAAGVDDYLEKPFSVDTLQSKVGQLLNGATKASIRPASILH